jgi:hypothetical protein
VLLNETVTVPSRAFEYRAPATGELTVLTSFETCEVKVGEQSLGSPPITRMRVAAGQYRVDIECPDGKNPPGQFVTVNPGTTATARILR